MVEQIAETDDDLTVKYLEGERDQRRRAESRSAPGSHRRQSHPGILRQLAAQQRRPAGSGCSDRLPAFTGGYPPGQWAPTPTPTKRLNARREDDAPLSALVFKIVTDPYVGRLAYFRVYSGTLTPGRDGVQLHQGPAASASAACCACTPTAAKISPKCWPAISALCLGLKETFTGDTLCDATNPIILENITFPNRSSPSPSSQRPPPTRTRWAKPAQALRRRSHLPGPLRRRDRADDHLRDGRAAPGSAGRPHAARIPRAGPCGQARRWPIANRSPARSRKPNVSYVKQTGGHGQYGHVVLALEPGEPGSGIVFENEIVGGVNPARIYPGGRKRRARGGRKRRDLAGYPVTDIKVSLFDGSYHEVDSNEMAFKMAGFDGLQRRRPKRRPSPAGADHEGGSGRPGRIPGRYHWPAERPARRDPGHGNAPRQCPGGASAWFPWQRCSDMPPICARPPRDVAFSRWNSIIMPGSQKAWPGQLLAADNQSRSNCFDKSLKKEIALMAKQKFERTSRT